MTRYKTTAVIHRKNVEVPVGTELSMGDVEAKYLKHALEEVKDEPKAEEPKAEDVKPDKPKPDEPKAEEPKDDEPKAEEPKAEEVKAEEPKVEATMEDGPDDVIVTEDQPTEVAAARVTKKAASKLPRIVDDGR